MAYENPNAYDDQQYLKASSDIPELVEALWEAGASLEDIERELQSAVQGIPGDWERIALTIVATGGSV